MASRLFEHVRTPEFERWLLWTPFFSVRLHRFSAGFIERVHNHRWNFATVMLVGSYIEFDTDCGIIDVLQRGSIRKHDAEYAHGVYSTDGAVTLVIAGRVRRHWSYVS